MGIDDLSFHNGIIRQPMSRAQCAALLAELPGWRIETADHEMLAAAFEFADFVEAMSFANRVGELAETLNHHPELTVAWGSVSVKWWTHTARGITVNDIVLARETAKLAVTRP